MVKYDRTAAGAEELISITEADITIKKNGTVIKTIDKIEFALDEYGGAFEGAKKDPDGKITSGEKDMKEYKVKLSIGETVAVGDKIEVSFTKCKVNTIGSASSSVKPTAIQVALVDIDPSVDYYKELSATEYLEIFEEVTASQGGNGGQEQGNTGAGNGGQAAAAQTKTVEINPNIYGDPETNHGLQLVIKATDTTFFSTPLPKSGETWTVKLVGTSDAAFDVSMQFCNGWGGITGEAQAASFTTTEFTVEKDFTFSADVVASGNDDTIGKFQLFNGDSASTKKTLTLKTFTFTKKN